MLAAACVNNEPVHASIVGVQKWLIDQERLHTPKIPRLRVVLSSMGTESVWKDNFKPKGASSNVWPRVDSIDIIDTADRFKQSKANGVSILRDIDDTNLFVAIVTKRYINDPQTITEIERAFSRLISWS